MSTLYWKLIAGAVIAAVLGIGVASWLARGAKIERLEEWQTTVILATTDATVLPDKGGGRKVLAANQIVPAIAALRRTADSCHATLEGINTQSVIEKSLQTKLDAQLLAILAGQDKAAIATRTRITDLLERQSTGDREKDCEIMEADSNAAWDGWRK